MNFFRDDIPLNWPFSRQAWALGREQMEGKPFSQNPSTRQGRTVLVKKVLNKLLGHRVFGPLWRRGYQNASVPKLVTKKLSIRGLPKDLSGFTILHLTDLHLDGIPELGEHICDITRGMAPDICVMTGDFITYYNRANYRDILPAMERIVKGVSARYGIFAVLGNHDTWRLVPPFENLGIRMLVNESVTLAKEGATVMITGVDDPHEYLTKQAFQALKTNAAGVKLALVHTPELFREAQRNDYTLYMAGHTHGGQICLPGGVPVFVHLNRGHRFYRGKWQFGRMIGYTGQGVGAVGVPLRFNTHSEIALISLVPADEYR
ncbi:MAG TPA: metallophosphoesterase [Desulfobacteraceae bacterium]|mgnify:CR=1 FL=1|nr:metallophosphoesterase [Desulfobacteraceae bacterium]|tara:strand:- start:65 stop:1021 length:957 start_codon:yes stop_codon:yes gene_type:complete